MSMFSGIGSRLVVALADLWCVDIPGDWDGDSRLCHLLWVTYHCQRLALTARNRNKYSKNTTLICTSIPQQIEMYCKSSRTNEVASQYASRVSNGGQSTLGVHRRQITHYTGRQLLIEQNFIIIKQLFFLNLPIDVYCDDISLCSKARSPVSDLS